MEEGALQAPWLEVRGNHDNFDVKAPGGVQAHARSFQLNIPGFQAIETLMYCIKWRRCP
jgi:hypothetical protein